MTRRRRLAVELLEDKQLLTAVPELVFDFNQDVETPRGDSSQVLTKVGDTIFFFETEWQDRDHSFGRPGLWTIQDDSPTLLRVFESERRPSRCCRAEGLGYHAGKFVFQLDHREFVELWVSDGTVDGTRAFARISGNPQILVDSIGDLLLVAADEQLWKSDGTFEGTSLLANGGDSRFAQLFANGTEAYFALERDSDPFRSFGMTDGTSDGTRWVDLLTIDVSQDPLSGRPIYSSVKSGIWQWYAIGTAGHELLDSVAEQLIVQAQSSESVVANDRLFVLTSGGELWVTDGTDANSRQIPLDFDTRYLDHLTPVGDRVLFVDKAEGVTWITDGTPEGTIPLANVPVSHPTTAAVLGDSIIVAYPQVTVTDSIGSEPITLVDSPTRNAFLAFTEISDQLYFRFDAGLGPAIWKTDGTVAGTKEVFRRYDWTADSRFSGEPFRLGGALFVRPTDSFFRGSFWSTNGTTDGTSVAEVLVDATIVEQFPNYVFFRRPSESGVQELWVLDQSHNARNLGLIPWRSSFLALGDDSFLAISNFGVGQVWFIDAASGETRLSETDVPIWPPNSFAALDNELYFVVGTDVTASQSIWKTDGTESGTIKVFEGAAWVGNGPRNLLAVGSQLFFTVSTSEGTEVWTSNGTESGTKKISTLTGSFGGPTNVYQVAGKFAMFRSFENRQGEFWVVDENGVTTLELHGSLEEPIDYGGGLAIRDSNSQEYWVTTDGIQENLQRLRLGSDLFANNNKLYFVRETPSGIPRYFDEFNQTIWVSDGTLAGTRVIADLSLTGVEFERPLSVLNDRLLFIGEDLEHGAEVWSIEIQPTLPADINFDGVVDFVDFLILSRNFGKDTNVTFSEGDINADGQISFADFMLISQSFGRQVES